MERIGTLIRSFSKSELKNLKSYLSFVHTKGENKMLDLIQLIERKPHITQDEASKKMYGDPKSKAFIMLKSRLYDKILEVIPMTFFRTISDPVEQNSVPAVLVEVRKHLLQAQELKRRKFNSLAVEQLKIALEKVRSGFYHEIEMDIQMRIIAYDKKKKSGQDSLDEYNELQSTQKKLNVQAKAVSTHQYYMNTYNRVQGSTEAKINFLEATIPELEEEAATVKSPLVDYYLLHFKRDYYSLLGDRKQVILLLRKLSDLLSNNQLMYSPKKMAGILYGLSLEELESGNYETALKECLEARDLWKSGPYDFPSAEGLLLIYFYLRDKKNFYATLDYLTSLSEHTSDSATGMAFTNYIHSCQLFREGKFRESMRLHSTFSEFNFDKDGWISAIRIFEIQTLIELEEFDVASSRIESLRKHFERYRPVERMITIYKMLSALEKNSFTFADFKSEAEYLQQLKEELVYVHQYELIRFDDWYIEKKKKVLVAK